MGALPEAVEQAGIAQQLQMARDARLALAQDLRQLADGQLAVRAQHQQAQAGRLGGGAEGGKYRVHPSILGRRWPHRRSTLHCLNKYIKIYLYLRSHKAAAALFLQQAARLRIERRMDHWPTPWPYDTHR